jgi:hypothetical protein
MAFPARPVARARRGRPSRRERRRLRERSRPRGPLGTPGGRAARLVTGAPVPHAAALTGRWGAAARSEAKQPACRLRRVRPPAATRARALAPRRAVLARTAQTQGRATHDAHAATDCSAERDNARQRPRTRPPPRRASARAPALTLATQRRPGRGVAPATNPGAPNGPRVMRVGARANPAAAAPARRRGRARDARSNRARRVESGGRPRPRTPRRTRRRPGARLAGARRRRAGARPGCAERTGRHRPGGCANRRRGDAYGRPVPRAGGAGAVRR